MHRTLPTLLSSWLAIALCGLGLIGSAAYACSIAYAWLRGWALPTTALVHSSGLARWAADKERYLGIILLVVAAVGGVAGWITAARTDRVDDETRLTRAFLWCVFPVAFAALVLSISAMWSGMIRLGDQHSSNIGGLIPFSDAANYLTAAFDQAKEGYWNETASRRPLAAAFRSTLLFLSGYSLQVMLLLQAGLLAASIWLATRAVVLWRGVWAGFAFFGLTYIYVRAYAQTTLTEPLGLVWALLSIPFLIHSFKSKSVNSALVAFAMTTVALMTRMGSMFTVPALLVWLVWHFGRTASDKTKIGTLAVGILVAIAGVNYSLQKLYSGPNTEPAGNFSYTICGLTLGTDWTGCPAKLASEGNTLPDGDAAAKQLLSMALGNFQKTPAVFFKRLMDGANEFRNNLVRITLYGPTAATPPNRMLMVLKVFVIVIFAIGFTLYAISGLARREFWFWPLFWVSLAVSASITYFDDGARVLAVSFPMMALFFAMGFGSSSDTRKSTEPRYGAAALLVSAAVFIIAPGLAHSLNRGPVDQVDGDIIVSGQMSGFLIVGNTDNLRKDIPSIRVGDFKAMIQQSGVERYQGLFSPETPAVPFGFVFAPRMEKGAASFYQFIVPPEVMERPDVPAWHFKTRRWDVKRETDRDYWFYVTKAEPLEHR